LWGCRVAVHGLGSRLHMSRGSRIDSDSLPSSPVFSCPSLFVLIEWSEPGRLAPRIWACRISHSTSGALQSALSRRAPKDRFLFPLVSTNLTDPWAMSLYHASGRHPPWILSRCYMHANPHYLQTVLHPFLPQLYRCAIYS